MFGSPRHLHAPLATCLHLRPAPEMRANYQETPARHGLRPLK
jgi:hypothetical protein